MTGAAAVFRQAAEPALAAATGGRGGLIFGVVVGCEIGFWTVLLLGLIARYVLRRPRLGGVLLVCVPLVDLVLIAVSILDLRTGGTAGLTHSLAAAYLGISVAFGPELVRSADAKFARRFGAGAEPEQEPGGADRVRREWAMWGRCVGALALSCALTALMYLLADAGSNALDLWNFEIQLAVVTVIWFVGWPLRLTVFPPREPVRKERAR